MAFTLTPWIENAIILAPFAYAIGFLIAENTIAYGFSGLAASGFALILGFHFMNLRAMMLFSVYTAALATIGLAAGAIYRARRLNHFDKIGTDLLTIETNQNPTPYSIFTGKIYDAKDKTERITGATVRVTHTSIMTKTDDKGVFRLDVPDTALLLKKNIIIHVNHSGYYTQYSKPLQVKAGIITTIDVPLEPLLSSTGAMSHIRVSLTDDHGKIIAPDLFPGQRFGCKIQTEHPLTFDKSIGKEVSHDQGDLIELIDQTTGQPLLLLTENSLPTQGHIAYIDPQTIFVTGSVPGHYLDGPGNTPKTPLSPHKDIRVKIIAHLNIT